MKRQKSRNNKKDVQQNTYQPFNQQKVRSIES